MNDTHCCLNFTFTAKKIVLEADDDEVFVLEDAV